MKEAAKMLEFELAATLRDQIILNCVGSERKHIKQKE